MPKLQTNQPLFVQAGHVLNSAVDTSKRITDATGLHGAVDTVSDFMADMYQPHARAVTGAPERTPIDAAKAGASIALTVGLNKGVGSAARFLTPPAISKAVYSLSPEIMGAMKTGKNLSHALQADDVKHLSDFMQKAQYGDIGTYTAIRNKVLPLLEHLNIHKAPASQQIKIITKILDNRPQARDLVGRWLGK